MSAKNVNKNMLLNMFKTILSIVFPLITYPYATRVLGAVNFGKVSFAQSIISYIALIAALGISNYAIREGGYYRSDNEKIKRFASEIFTFNLGSTVIAYVVLLALLIISSNLKLYTNVLIIQSLSIIFVTVGVDWLNVIYEDYLYITIRSIVVHIITLGFLFLFVHTPDDYILYAAISVINNGAIAVANLFHVRKECKFAIRKPNIKRHIKPILVLFSNNLAVSIYTNADITMTGWFFGDYYVGLYTIASRIYTILKQVIAAAYSVTVTRLTEYHNQGNVQEFKLLLNQVINNLILLCLPITIGGFFTSDYIIRIIAGDEFVDAIVPLRVLLCTLPFAVIGGALAYCMNLPLRRENINLKCTSVSAIVNIALNAILMPRLNILGAAIATLLSEATVSIILFISLRKWHNLLDFKNIGINTLKTILACVPIVPVYYTINALETKMMIRFGLIVFLSAIAFTAVSIVLKNDALIGFVEGFRSKKSKKEEM